jgi:putative nucleic acid binding protein
MFKKHLASIGVLAIFVIFALGSLGEKSDENHVMKTTPELTVSAKKIYEDYESNEVAADQIYGDKVIIVSGIIDGIGKDITDTAYISLDAEASISGVKCMFSRDQEEKVAIYSKGDFVSLKGKVSGKMINILLRGCVFN